MQDVTILPSLAAPAAYPRGKPVAGIPLVRAAPRRHYELLPLVFLPQRLAARLRSGAGLIPLAAPVLGPGSQLRLVQRDQRAGNTEGQQQHHCQGPHAGQRRLPFAPPPTSFQRPHRSGLNRFPVSVADKFLRTTLPQWHIVSTDPFADI